MTNMLFIHNVIQNLRTNVLRGPFFFAVDLEVLFGICGRGILNNVAQISFLRLVSFFLSILGWCLEQDVKLSCVGSDLCLFIRLVSLTGVSSIICLHRAGISQSASETND